MFSENIRALRNKVHMSQKALADLLFVSQQTVAKWETNRATPNPDTVVKLADIFGVSTDYLLGNGTNARTFACSEADMLQIPVYDSIPAGSSMEPIGDILGYEEAPGSWALGGKAFFAMKIKGNSMEPEYRQGDIIIFLKQSDFENNEDCAVAIAGDDWVFKRVEKLDGGILVKSLNPDYETKFYTQKQCEELPVEIKGVFWELRRTKRR